VDLSLQISPVGDTTAREVSAASQEVRNVLERLPGVEWIAPQRVPAPDQTKGGLVDLLGGLSALCRPRCAEGGVAGAADRPLPPAVGDEGFDPDQGRTSQFRVRSEEDQPPGAGERSRALGGGRASGLTGEVMARHALLIGVSEFTDQRLARLNAPINDVIALRSILQDTSRGSFDTSSSA
jgi:hypothetical protein